MNKQKKVVEYLGDAFRLEVGKSAILQGTLNHPELSNRQWEANGGVITSSVVWIDPEGTGIFETMNSRYVPTKQQILLG